MHRSQNGQNSHRSWWRDSAGQPGGFCPQCRFDISSLVSLVYDLSHGQRLGILRECGKSRAIEVVGIRAEAILVFGFNIYEIALRIEFEDESDIVGQAGSRPA